ncbi:MAG TPA: helix-turn-helix domain-containing protein, partial [Usitatibacter sp.]|nr:helix-turn-helix domain-containing protein [Usitatibacter sp.]
KMNLRARPRSASLPAMKGFGQFCPVAVAAEVFSARWTPVILRELLAGTDRFNDLHRGIPLISRALLARRLLELERAGVVRREPLRGARGHRYALTPAGEEFRAVIESLGAWGQRWTVRVERRNLDAGFLMWNVRRRIALERLPRGRTVARFAFTGVPAARRGPKVFWLLLQPGQADLCVEDPGFEVDLYVEADLASFARVWLGDVALEAAIRSGEVRLAGPAELRRAFPSWLLLSRFAAVPRPGASRG